MVRGGAGGEGEGEDGRNVSPDKMVGLQLTRCGNDGAMLASDLGTLYPTGGHSVLFG